METVLVGNLPYETIRVRKPHPDRFIREYTGIPVP
jgi:hypothetical protein